MESQQLTRFIRHEKGQFTQRQGYNGLEWEAAVETAARDKYDTPSPALFMSYALHVRNAKQRKATLCDHMGEPLNNEEVDALFAYVFAPATDNEGIHVWLNGRCVQGSGFKGLDLETRSYRFEDNKTMITLTRNPLKRCLDQVGFADLDSLNEQGLPTRKSERQVYVPGKNIFFAPLSENSVSGFGAGSGGVVLGCDGDPRNSDACLGVLAYAEST